MAEFEKYAAPARLALGAAREINNPLLGILWHLELELKNASGEARAQAEPCIDGAKRISSTPRGLLNYARPGPLVLSKISLQCLIADTLTFPENQPMMRGKRLQNNVPAELPLIRADDNQPSQVLMNPPVECCPGHRRGRTHHDFRKQVDACGQHRDTHQ